MRPSTRLVGRSGELAELNDAAGLGDGGGRAVLLAGDAGIGKTRLLTELRDRALGDGWRVLVGQCAGIGGDDLPYQPFIELFGRHTGARSEVVEAFVSAAGERAGEAPLLLVIEDVQWADPSTRAVLTRFFRGPQPGLSVIASYRTDDLHRRHPLRADIADWSRMTGLTRLRLRPLSDGDVRDLIVELQPSGISDDDIERIVARAEGNAFFTEELVTAARHGEGLLSGDLSTILLVHLDALDDHARAVVRAISVAGRRVSHQLLARVVDWEGPQLEHALRAATDRQVLVSGPADEYAFRHALLAEAVYDDLLPGERVRWHRAYADALGAAAAVGTAAELARHARAAHDLPAAIRACLRAGDEAAEVGGPAEATRHYELALELLADDRAGTPEIDVVDVVVRASTSAAAAGWLPRALELPRHQLTRLPPDAPPLQRVVLLHAVATIALLLDDVTVDTLGVTTQAVQLLSPTTPDAVRAGVLAAHARACAWRDREDEARGWARQAIELARRQDLPAVLADATTTLARLNRRDPVEQVESTLRTSILDAQAAGEPAAELRSRHGLGTVLYEVGRLSEAQQIFEQASARAVELRRPWAPYGVDGRAMAAVVSYVRGDWQSTVRLVDTASQSPPPLAGAVLSAVGMLVGAGRGQLNSLDVLAQVRPWWHHDGLIALLAGAAAVDLYGDSGRLDQALQMHDEVVDLLITVWAGPTFQARIRLAGVALGHVATAAAGAGRDRATVLMARGERLWSGADVAVRAAPENLGIESRAWWQRVNAEYLRLKWLAGDSSVERGDLVEAWRAGVASFERFGHTFEVARSRARLAAVSTATGLRHEGETAAGLALAAADELGARPLVAEIHASRTPRTAPAGSAATERLTAREVEVLQLVASGRSNREIGQVLFISAKTVSVHLTNSFTKLGASRRTEAVALARQHGLIDP